MFCLTCVPHPTSVTLQAVTKKTSGALKKAIRAIMSVAQDPTNYWCERLHEALQGQLVGNDDKSLIRTIVSRAGDAPSLRIYN